MILEPPPASWLTWHQCDQGVEEFHEAVQPLRAALEMGVSRCNQADMEVRLGVGA